MGQALENTVGRQVIIMSQNISEHLPQIWAKGFFYTKQLIHINEIPPTYSFHNHLNIYNNSDILWKKYDDNTYHKN